MAMARKGSRKITVAGIDYRWRVNRPRRISDWRMERERLDEKFCAIAEQYGLREVADVVFHIPIELYSEPTSKILVKYFGLVVDGFLGIEQVTKVKPSLIAEIIREALQNGWQPEEKEDVIVEIFDNSAQQHCPAVMVMLGKNESVQVKQLC